MAKLYEYADDVQRTLHTKFPKGHFLHSAENVDHILQWNTFFRRNPNRLAIDYFRINLYPYQEIELYEMAAKDENVTIGSRNIAKTFITALYACCYCTTHPYGEFVITASTKPQANLLIDEKIGRELCNLSPTLASEIDKIVHTNQMTTCKFKNHAQIIVVVSGENARGNRSTCLVRDEYRLIDAKTDDGILSPMQHPRNAPYVHRAPYNEIIEQETKLLNSLQREHKSTEGMFQLLEQPCDIYLSSSWIDTKGKGKKKDEQDFIWKIADGCINNMFHGRRSSFLAFDESIVLLHGLKTMEQMIKYRDRCDPIIWQTEYLNLRVKENTRAFFTYNTVNDNRISKQVWYPRQNRDYIARKRHSYDIPKQYGEIRVVACDLAFMAGVKNDASAYICMRALPRTSVYTNNDGENIETRNGSKRSVPYIETHEGMAVEQQAIRIRQLYEDFHADYIVIDARNAGVAVVQALSRVLYDEHRKVEYAPLCCMNDKRLEAFAQSPDANRCIYAVSANAKLNSDMALSLRRAFIEHDLDLLVPFDTALDEILNQNNDYVSALEAAEQHFYEVPFLETQELVSELIELEYTKNANDEVQIFEKRGNRKDRFSALEYANYFTEMKMRESADNDDYGYLCLVN